MAAFEKLIQQVARALEEARVERPAGDDLRARLGYGTGDEDEGEEGAVPDPVWEPETEQGAEAPPEWESASERVSRRRREAGREPETAQGPWAPATIRMPGVPAPAPRPMSGTHSSPRPSPASRPQASSAPLLRKRILARLRTTDALREAFVVKEILDRPPGRRTGSGRPGTSMAQAPGRAVRRGRP